MHRQTAKAAGMYDRYISLYEILRDNIFLHDELIYFINNDKLRAYNPKGEPVHISDSNYPDCIADWDAMVTVMPTKVNLSDPADSDCNRNPCIVERYKSYNIYVLRDDIQKFVQSMHEQPIPNDRQSCPEDKPINPKEKTTLFIFILALIRQGNIDTSDSSFVKNIVQTAADMGLKLSKSRIYDLRKELAAFEREHLC